MVRVSIDQQKKRTTAASLALRHHQRVVGRIFDGARFMVPRGSHMSGSGKRRPGQTLGQSLKTVAQHRPTMLVTKVGSDKRYAATAHQGSSPHFIRAKGKMLKFEWERGNIVVRARGRGGRKRGRAGPSGNYFFFKLVNHPGNKRPVRYLTTPMHLYGRMLGFRTSSARVNRSRLP